MNTNDLTPDQINWLSVSGSREVKRLPSHFVCVTHSFRPEEVDTSGGYFFSSVARTQESLNCGDEKSLNHLRVHIENNFAGRYFIGYNNNGCPDAVAPPQTLIVAFEDPAEASFFGLKLDYLIKKISEESSKKNN